MEYDLAHHKSPSSSVVRAPDRCTGGHGFDSRRGLRFFSLSHACDKLNIPSFLFLSELNIYHLSFFIISILLDLQFKKGTLSKQFYVKTTQFNLTISIWSCIIVQIIFNIYVKHGKKNGTILMSYKSCQT